jgi:hypothetical protein
MREPTHSRRAVLSLAAAGLVTRRAWADEVIVPVDLQVSLLSKVAPYDRNFAARAGDAARVLVVRKGGAEAIRTATQLEKALSEISDIGGLPVRVSSASYSSPKELADLCNAQSAAIVCFSAGFQGDIPAIAEALSGVNILSVTVTNAVAAGVVLGFDLVSGKPKLLCNLTQARKQNVSFKSEVLKLMRVVE